MDAPEPTRAEESEPFAPTMPVELWFGEHHIGVKADTATCVAFQRFANQILADFRAAKTPS